MAGKKDVNQGDEARGRSGGDPAAEAARSEVKDAEARFDISIYRAWCKSCGICAAFCPRDCIEMNEEGHPMVVQPERCTGCGFCEIHCPDFAISVRPKKAPKPGIDVEEVA